jgi:hydrogenase nickel incorporation protein HypA/HybF
VVRTRTALHFVCPYVTVPEQSTARKGRRLHELSVALSLIDGITESARRDGFERVLAVRVRVGALSGVAPDALRFSWNLATVGTLAADSALEIEDVPLAVYCDRCAAERAPRAASGLICPECSNVCPRIVRGRELQLVALEVPE